MGTQQQSKGSKAYHWWFSPVVIARLELNSAWAVAFRAEQYTDRKGVIIPNFNNKLFNTSGLSANLDYAPASQIMWRIEGRWFHSPDQIFLREQGYSRNNFFITTSLTAKIGK